MDKGIIWTVHTNNKWMLIVKHMGEKLTSSPIRCN